MNKAETKKRSRSIIAALTVAVPAVFAGILLGCNGEEKEEIEERKPGEESGAYYCEVENEEYLINLYDVDKVSMFVRDENKYGTYVVGESRDITMTFGEEVLSGTIENNELHIGYAGRDMWFKKKIYYTVRFETNSEEIKVESQEVLNGKTATKPTDPERGGGVHIRRMVRG